VKPLLSILLIIGIICALFYGIIATDQDREEWTRRDSNDYKLELALKSLEGTE
jgi:hypothetical protein